MAAAALFKPSTCRSPCSWAAASCCSASAATRASGGILDAVVGEGGSSSATEQIDKRIEAQLAKTRATPRDAAVWAELARLRFQRAGIDGLAADDTTYTDKGKQKLGLAAQAWERHLALEPKQPNVRVARIMVQAYGRPASTSSPRRCRRCSS